MSLSMALHGSSRGGSLRPIILLLLSFIFPVAAVAAPSCSGRLPSLIGPQEFGDATYDYLIVGGGTAGLALASRLSEDENTKVGVIEAGQFHPDDPLLDVPAYAGRATGNLTYDWQFVTVPQAQAGGRAITMPRGKVLGGSSALNLMAWTRASQPEYDVWQDLAQQSSSSSGWTWDGLLPYMRKSASVFPASNQTGPGIPAVSEAAFDPRFEGFSGPVPASFNTWYSDPFPAYLETLNTLGVATNFNPDSGTTAGSTNTRSDVDRARGTRSYAAPTYFCRAASRPNLHVVTGAQATRVVLVPYSSDNATSNGAAYKATGVEYTSSGSGSYTAYAKKEVILSAGVYQSPQLLELSGVGNKTLLENIGIKTLVDLPGVGENLQDHLFSFVQYKLKPGFVTFDTLRTNATFAAEQTALYNANKTGILAATHSALAFLPPSAFLDATTTQALLAAFDRAVAAADKASSPLAKRQYAVQRRWLEQGSVPQLELIMWSQGIVGLEDNATYVTVFPGGLHMLNRGSVHINTSMPLAHPVIDPAWLTNDFDIMLLLEGLKFARRIGTVQPLASIVSAVTSPPADLQTDAALIEYIRQAATSAQHPMGSAAMGPRELGGVVDANLIVHGTKNLRVCDASVFPIGIGAHLQETVYAIAEKLADDIKKSKT